MSIKPPVTYYGGKQRLAPLIVSLIPPHEVYCEPFFGGGAVFFCKPPSPLEIINDLDERVVTFYEVCKSDFPLLRDLIQRTPASRAVHRRTAHILKNPEGFSSVRRAWAFWVQANLSFSAKLLGGYGYAVKGAPMAKRLIGKKLSFNRRLRDRFDLVDIECNDALQVIRSRDSESTFFYLDPPYFNSDCGHYCGYLEADFTKLLETLQSVKGKWLMSSYPSAILAEFKQRLNWSQIMLGQQPVAVSSRAKKSKTEVLTANFELPHLKRLSYLLFCTF